MQIVCKSHSINQTISMLLILLILLFVPSNCIVLFQQTSAFWRLNLPNTSVGPESITFDSHGRGPYTGISDGRIVRYDRRTAGFVDFAFTSGNRSKALCDGTNNPALRPICGRPFGIEFFLRESLLFIADAFLGLRVVGPKGGLATGLATAAEGIPFRFLNGLSVDQRTGDAYFTDFSSKFLQTQIQQAIAANDSTGRLLKYDYRTKNVTVLLRGLSGANGVAISSNRSYVLVAEFIANRTRRFWLHGTKAFTSEIVATFPGMPDNIRRDPFGNFFVAVNVQRPAGGPRLIPTAIRINGDGQTLQTLPLDRYYNNITISEVLQHGKQCYFGSVEANSVVVLNG